MRCLFCFHDCSFVAETYAGRSGAGCTPAASIAHMRTATVGLRRSLLELAALAVEGKSFAVALAVGAQDRSYLLAGERVE
jgi:hypothetical protein